VETDGQWKALTKAMGQEDWGSDGRFAAVTGRMRFQDEIDRKIEAWTQSLPNTEVERRLKATAVPAERMRRINDLLDSENGATVFAKMEERRMGSMLTTRLPFSLSSDSLPPPRSAPSLGEHTTEVLREWLNLSREEIDAIKKQEALI
jgi:crotonobetainyl-CoA:carnitine CoA-transferase CaiB-like acyl-CoA transferase